MNETFNIRYELSRAAKLPMSEVELPLVHSLRPHGFHKGYEGPYYPTVWESHGRFVCGYTVDNLAVLFIESPVKELHEARRFAKHVTGLAAEFSHGLR